MSEKKPLLSKKALLIALPILVIILIILVIKLPWPATSQVSGTMGSEAEGVQRAQKYRANQMSEADVVLKNPEFQKVVQSDAFQKLLKNEEFLKFASSGNLSNLASHGIIGLAANQNFVSLLNQQSFAALCNNETFNKLVGMKEFMNVIFDKNINYALEKGQLAKVEANALYKNLTLKCIALNPQFQVNAILSLMKSEDYKNVVNSQSFYALANNQMFYAFLQSGNLNAFPSGMVMMNLNNLGLVNLCQQQNFVSLAMSKQFMDLE